VYTPDGYMSAQPVGPAPYEDDDQPGRLLQIAYSGPCDAAACAAQSFFEALQLPNAEWASEREKSSEQMSSGPAHVTSEPFAAGYRIASPRRRSRPDWLAVGLITNLGKLSS
jgi:hypothetical protein